MTKGHSRFRPTVEHLEDRLTPYSLSGSPWGNVNVSASFMPDGTITDNGSSSALFTTLNALAPTATWQREFARALQTWATASPLNFRFVPDNGAASGSAGLGQGDSNFGDIRFGGYVFNIGYVAYTYFPSSSTRGGDSFLNTPTTSHIGTNLYLYSVFLHEPGPPLGLDNSPLNPAVMSPSISTVFTALSADDIAGIQAIYGARQPDAYDAAAAKNTAATA